MMTTVDDGSETTTDPEEPAWCVYRGDGHPHDWLGSLGWRRLTGRG